LRIFGSSRRTYLERNDPTCEVAEVVRRGVLRGGGGGGARREEQGGGARREGGSGVADARGNFIHVLPLPEAVAPVPVERTAGRRRLTGGRRPSYRGRASLARASFLRLVQVVP
jgi:hypothetical protein